MSEARRSGIDVRMLIAIGAAVLLLGAYWAVVSLSEEYYVIEAPKGSVYSSDPNGFKSLLAYLRELGIEAESLQRFDELPQPPATIVVGAVDPLEVDPTVAEGERLQRWVKRGGRLVLVGPSARFVLAGTPVGASSAGEAAEETTLAPRVPSTYADRVSEVTVGTPRILAENAEWVTHIKDTFGQVLVSRSLGEGEVVWLAPIEPFTNARLGDGDNARLATLLAASARPVYFDEYHHGFARGGGIWERLGSGGRAASVLVVLALGVALLASARRLGPAIDPVVERPARGGAYIDALAELYRKAGARAEALASLEEGLRAAAVKRHGSLPAAMQRHPALEGVLERSRAARGGSGSSAASGRGGGAAAASGVIGRDEFVEIAREIARVRREVER